MRPPGAKTPQEAMDSLCAEQEKVLQRLERAKVQGDIGPKLAEEHDLAYWNKPMRSPRATSRRS
jgi:glycerol transport system substrate-binding protein